MKATAGIPDRQLTPREDFGMWPVSREGRLGLWAALVGLGSWLVLPLITILFRESVPITDTGLMPAIGVVLVDVAAGVNLWLVIARRERAQMSVLAAAVTSAAALFFTFMVVGELLGGA